MKEIRKKKNGKYQIVENFFIISYPISIEFDTYEEAYNYFYNSDMSMKK